MAGSSPLYVVTLAVGGLYGPFRDEEAARTWAEREVPQHVWNVKPLTKVTQGDSHLAIFDMVTYTVAA
jgi:hypothetical protein